MLALFIEQLTGGNSLTASQVKEAVAALTNESVSPETKADFLTALSKKGETVDEITAFAQELRDKSIQPPLDAETRAREILDVCGTGGDHLGTFNISTTVAFVVAAAGVTVAKHGNRAITSQSGSADVLEALGIRIEITPEQAAQQLKQHNFTFFFAPKYHPAFKHIGPARKLCATRGQRTIFNLLGPLLNPAHPTAQLIGVPRAELCEPIARVLQAIGIRRGMVVSGTVELLGGHDPTGKAGIDEISTLGETTVAEFYQDRGFNMSVLGLKHFPLQRAHLGDLAGGNSHANAQIIRNILEGNDRGPKRDAVLLNAAAALFVGNRVRSLGQGWELAGNIIDSGAAAAKLRDLAA